MDRGAHFFRCDFQVHTPRDARWSGGDAVSDSERLEYAAELILACRRKDLGAIAITDHHDFAFFPYVRKAALEEVDDHGISIPSEQRIIVFPGLELTLTAPTCQALLILDAHFPENLLQSVLTTFAITPAPSSDSKGANVQRIPQAVVRDLTDFYEKLNTHEHLKGRFIVLPNVSEGGNGTMLRSGFANFYKTMPCVGGYTDGPVTQFGTGNQSIVNGENRDYGFKSIAVFQTSDNRKRDHSDLGLHTTWVKWSEPTAEALRQACLAKESRISQQTPDLPQLWVTSMTVSNSKFLGRVNVEFNQQYNSIIGGRGTGKSTILEYLRWGLCDSLVEALDGELAPVQAKRKKLVADTLAKFDGEVHVTFLLNDVRHIVKRSSKTQEILVRIGSGDFTRATEEEVRSLFSVQAYSQKQLSSVGVRLDELKRFIEVPVKRQLDQIKSALRETESQLRAAHISVLRKREIELEVGKYAIEIDSLAQQLSALRAALTGLSDTDQEVIKQKRQYDAETFVVNALREELTEAQALLQELAHRLPDPALDEDATADFANPDLINRLGVSHRAHLAMIRTRIAELNTVVSTVPANITVDLAEWDFLSKAFDATYQATIARATASQQQLKQIRELEKRVGDIQKLQTASRTALEALGDPESSYAAGRSNWIALHKQKIRVFDSQCRDFSALSGGLIKAEMSGSVDVEAMRANIKAALSGMNIREPKIEELCQSVVNSGDPVDAWNAILTDLEKLTGHGTSGADTLPPTPTLDKCTLTLAEKTRVAASLKPSKWLDLSVTELAFTPLFRYCTNKSTNQFIEFADASAGQQATALLTVLLNQEGGPLIIDQPEDDVDSKMVSDIVRLIWRAKTRRQLIFASHNANFVVNGDAELVICCDYVSVGDQTGGKVKTSGAIDGSAVREEITLVTEGGEKAFKLRKEKYGF